MITGLSFSGRILRLQRRDPGSIPGGSIFSDAENGWMKNKMEKQNVVNHKSYLLKSVRLKILKKIFINKL